MPTYRVTWGEIVWWTMEVEAESEDEAAGKWEWSLMPLKGNPAHQCLEDEGGMIDGSLEIVEVIP